MNGIREVKHGSSALHPTIGRAAVQHKGHKEHQGNKNEPLLSKQQQDGDR
jgi:hypothetical protein